MVYSVSSRKIVSETFDDEVVIVNLENGAYYSLRDSALKIWKMIEAGCTQKQMLDHSRNPDNSLVFIKKLVEEGLIVPEENATGNHTFVGEVDGIPEFNKYDDMKDLLLLDPIHEVDQTGWPNKKPNE